MPFQTSIQGLLLSSVLLLLPSSASSQQDPALIGAGAGVYASTCARCHNARPGAEHSDADWVPIVMHMRARANLSKTQAAAVLAFLQATNAPEPGSATPAAPSTASARVFSPSMRDLIIESWLSRRAPPLISVKNWSKTSPGGSR
jgi:mono/diheme cytochrome c family protein